MEHLDVRRCGPGQFDAEEGRDARFGVDPGLVVIIPLVVVSADDLRVSG
jgi:hypothetical protein